MQSGHLLPGQAVSVDHTAGVLPQVEPGYLGYQRPRRVYAHGGDQPCCFRLLHGHVFHAQGIYRRRSNVHRGCAVQLAGHVGVQREDQPVVGLGKGQQRLQNLWVGSRQINVNQPKPGRFGVPGQQLGQRQKLGVVEIPHVCGEIVVLDGAGHVPNAAKVNLQFFRSEFAVGALQQVVDALANLEKSGRRVDYHPFRRDAQRVHEGDHALEDFRDTATGGGAVEVYHPQVAQVGGYRGQIVGQLGRD